MMKVSQITENKVVGILDSEEMELYEIVKDFSMENTYNKQLLVDILEGANCLEKMSTHKLIVELFRSKFGSAKVSITLLTDEEYEECLNDNPILQEMPMVSANFNLDENNNVIDDISDYEYTNEDNYDDNYYYNDDDDYDDDDWEDDCSDKYSEFGNLFETSTDTELMNTVNSYKNNKQIKKEQIFCFSKLDDVITISHLIKNQDLGKSSLYKDVNKNEFYLIIQPTKISNELETVLSKIEEFSQGTSTLRETHIKEHYKCIIETNAIESLSNF